MKDACVKLRGGFFGVVDGGLVMRCPKKARYEGTVH